MNIGIHGLGVYLPEEVRRNDWWPQAIVEEWRRKRELNVMRGKGAEPPRSEGARLILQELASLENDVFEGVVERRVMPEGSPSVAMEAKAAEEALARAGIEPHQIDFLFSYTPCPDVLGVPSACALHRKLGLRRDCLSLVNDSVCNAFAVQLKLAQSMIQSGQARFGLLVQSSNLRKTIAIEDPASAWFGDGATAVVVGPVSEGYGLLASAHRTDGEYYRAIGYGVPGQPNWYDEGRVVLAPIDRQLCRAMALSLADYAQEVLVAALAQADLQKEEVDFYASHQATRWLRRVTKDYVGLANARGIDTFSWAGSLAASNVPFQLAIAEREGQLEHGDVVATFTGGAGSTWAGMVLRWGR